MRITPDDDSDHTVYQGLNAVLFSSDLAMSLLSMAALNLDSTDADAFGTACNNALIQYCQTFFQVDEGSTPTTIVYNQADVGSLPVGYDASFQPKISAPCSIVEYGSGGIASNGADMLQFLLYAMSPNYRVLTSTRCRTLDRRCHHRPLR